VSVVLHEIGDVKSVRKKNCIQPEDIHMLIPYQLRAPRQLEVNCEHQNPIIWRIFFAVRDPFFRLESKHVVFETGQGLPNHPVYYNILLCYTLDTYVFVSHVMAAGLGGGDGRTILTGFTFHLCQMTWNRRPFRMYIYIYIYLYTCTKRVLGIMRRTG